MQTEREDLIKYLDVALDILRDSHEHQTAFYFARLREMVEYTDKFPTERAAVADTLAL